MHASSSACACAILMVVAPDAPHATRLGALARRQRRHRPLRRGAALVAVALLAHGALHEVARAAEPDRRRIARHELLAVAQHGLEVAQLVARRSISSKPHISTIFGTLSWIGGGGGERRIAAHSAEEAPPAPLRHQPAEDLVVLHVELVVVLLDGDLALELGDERVLLADRAGVVGLQTVLRAHRDRVAA